MNPQRLNNTLFVIEDDPASIRLLRLAFEEDCSVETFETAEACLERTEVAIPALFLFDIGLPGVDGYTACQTLKELPATAGVPVIFISGHVDMPSRLRGYDVGAHDFITKPFDVQEVQRKVMRVLDEARERDNLSARLNDSDTLTGLILSNLDEYAVLVKYLRELNACEQASAVAELTHAMLRGYGLSGVVQLRLPQGDVTVDTQGQSTPIMVSVLNHVRNLERIFEFHRRGVYNFERVTLMIDNMPIDDPERCGRLRDHLAIAVETADARLQGLLAFEANARAYTDLDDAIVVLQGTLAAFAERHAYAQHAGPTLMMQLENEIHIAISHLHLTELQEDSIAHIVREKAKSLVALYDAAEQTQAALGGLEQRLNDMHARLRG